MLRKKSIFRKTYIIAMDINKEKLKENFKENNNEICKVIFPWNMSIIKKRRRINMESGDLVPTYREIAEIIGVDNTLLLYNHFRGQQISLPQRIFSIEYVERYINEHYDGKNIKVFAKEFNYSERRIRQLLNKKSE